MPMEMWNVLLLTLAIFMSGCGRIWGSFNTSQPASSGPAAPTKIYRSVGPGNTSVLACGGGDGSGCSNNAGNLTINGTTTTFASAAPNDIGVGDAIVYDCNRDGSLDAGDCIAFIDSRTSSTQYSVQDKSGNAPTAYGAANVWRIYRAYTSVANAVDATSGGTENSAICAINATLCNFDGWTGGTNLVSANEQWNVAMYGDAADSSDVTISGWTTSTANYIKIYAPYLSSEVGASQRTSGVWNNAKARFEYTAGIWNPFVIENDVWIDGLQFEDTATTGTSSSAVLVSALTPLTVKISNCLIDLNLSGSATGWAGLHLGINGTVSGSTEYAWNNIVYNGLTTGTTGILLEVNGTGYFSNNTVDGPPIGFQSDAFTGSTLVIAKNNIAQGCASSCYATNNGGTYSPASTNNIASDTTAPGSNALNSKTVTFVNPSAGDYRLSPSDAIALNAGVDLSSDPNLAFNTDIDNIPRPQGPAWDIGASELLSSSSNATELLALTFPTVTLTSFSAQMTFQGDADANNTGTIYYCDATVTPGCDPFVFGISAPMTRAGGQFTYSATGLTSGDTYNVEVIGSDPDGIFTSTITGSVVL